MGASVNKPHNRSQRISSERSFSAQKTVNNYYFAPGGASNSCALPSKELQCCRGTGLESRVERGDGLR
jgi:hypothetical protein